MSPRSGGAGERAVATGARGKPAARFRSTAAASALLAAALAVPAVLASPAPAAAQDAEAGRIVYDRWCAECHGADGEGNGPAADHMLPRPRDFVQARYQIRTTASGELPTDVDLMRILERGMPGTAMPAWPSLTDTQKRDVIAYIKSFSPFFERLTPKRLEVEADPGPGEDALASGRAAYETLECYRCHGPVGRGDGASAPTLEDWRELPIRAADLTEYWNFNGGSTVEDIHTRMMTGLDGTPMPAYADALASGIVTEQQLWDLARYVRSLGPEEPPVPSEVVVAARTEGPLPGGPDDRAWDELDAFYVPLVGQVIERPRQFAPTVDGVWVRAAHDGERIAMLVEWHDPSRSPDPAWNEWQTRIAAAMFPDGTEIPTTPLPDVLAVQFPPSIPDGAERPYFLMGSERDPVYLWHWTSERGASEARATGLGQVDPMTGGDLIGAAAFEDGRWRVAFGRTLEGDGDSRIAMREGIAIPMALFAWDGSSGETGKRGSVSTWNYLYLEEPGTAWALVLPILAALLTAAVLILVVRRAQASARRPAEEGARAAEARA